jgi:uncharacterized protein (DUF58 family)
VATAALAILLAVIGGKVALALLPVATGLLAAHSIGAVGVVLSTMTVAEKVAAVELAIQKAPNVIRLFQDLDPVMGAIVDDVRARRATGSSTGRIVAVVHGGPGGWGRAPVSFVSNGCGRRSH